MADTRKMTRDWIQYLKSNQIVVGSDPATGDLNYKRPVTTDDLFDFLGDDVDHDTVQAAIDKVKGTTPPATPAAPTIKDSTTKLSEDDILGIFNILATPAPPEAPDPQKKIDELNKIKRVIRDNMTDQQRKSLWRALNHA